MKGQFEIWLVKLNPARGNEPDKIRPAVVLQSNLLNQTDHPSTLICPITSRLSESENILRVRLEIEGSFRCVRSTNNENQVAQCRWLSVRGGSYGIDSVFDLNL